MASFVDDEGTNLTLKTLLAKSPNKILAVRAKRGLLEEARDEAMIFDIIDVLLLQRSLAAAVPHRELVLVHLRHGVVHGVLLGHDDDGSLLPRLLLAKNTLNANSLNLEKRTELTAGAFCYTGENSVVFFTAIFLLFFCLVPNN